MRRIRLTVPPGSIKDRGDLPTRPASEPATGPSPTGDASTGGAAGRCRAVAWCRAGRGVCAAPWPGRGGRRGRVQVRARGRGRMPRPGRERRARPQAVPLRPGPVAWLSRPRCRGSAAHAHGCGTGPVRARLCAADAHRDGRQRPSPQARKALIPLAAEVARCGRGGLRNLRQNPPRRLRTAPGWHLGMSQRRRWRSLHRQATTARAGRSSPGRPPRPRLGGPCGPPPCAGARQQGSPGGGAEPPAAGRASTASPSRQRAQTL